MQKTSSADAQLTQHPTLLIGMLVIAVFFSMGSRAVFSPLMPILQVELGITLSAAGSLFLIVGVSYAITILTSGFLSARIGHGLTIVTSLGLISVGLMCSGFASGIPLLAFGMLLIGAGAGAYAPSAVAMVSNRISYERRSSAFSFHEMGPSMSLLLVPLIVLVLDPWTGWRGVLFFMAGICFLSSLAFYRWAAMDGGVGAAPDLNIIGTILKMRSFYVAMVLMSAAQAGLHGVYAILPAFLVSEYALSPQYVNLLLAISRISSIVLLFFTGRIINRIGIRNTIGGVLLFTSLFTGLVGIVEGYHISIIVLLQPALLAVMFPALLASLSDIGESRYQNITSALIITVGVSFGGGAVPAILGVFGDLGLGWLGFICLGVFMLTALFFMIVSPEFGRERLKRSAGTGSQTSCR